MQALMLAAGMGKRLAKYTKNNTKCMVEVAGEKLIDHAIKAIRNAGIKRFVIVIGRCILRMFHNMNLILGSSYMLLRMEYMFQLQSLCQTYRR